MIYLILFWEFFKIGLLAVGGGLVTVPFLYDLAETYSWFTTSELTNMIAVSESTPGPLGVNMATYAGFKTAGIGGGLIATLGLIFPSVMIIILLARYMKRYQQTLEFTSLLKMMRPAVLALICAAGAIIAKSSIINWQQGVAFLIAFTAIHFIKKSPILYIVIGAICGIILA